MDQAKQWRRYDGTRIRGNIVDEVRDAIIREKANGYDLKVCIGTDSQVKGPVTEFATVIVILRKGRGGFMYINSEVVTQKLRIKDRMLKEVARSVEVAWSLHEIFRDNGVEMEVHADINTDPNFKSNDALKDAMGYIMGMGFVFRAKPYAFAGSSCANKVVQ